MSPVVIGLGMVLIWGGAIVMFIMAFTTKSAQQVLAERIHRELEREEVELLVKEEAKEMQKPLLQRILSPILSALGNKLQRKGAAHTHSGIDEMLEAAGHPLGMNAGSFFGLRILVTLGFGGVGLLAIPILSPLAVNILGPTFGSLVAPMLLGLTIISIPIGFILPKMLLRRTINKRRRQMGRAMADTVDLITLSLESGVAFDGAVGYAVNNTKGPLSEELARVLAEVSAGKSQSDAFRDMAIRAKMPELSLLVAAIDMAMRLGVNLASSLRAQATELRERRSSHAREQAAKLPVKMIFPLVFCIFPALFIVILGPAAIQLKEVSDAGMF